MANKPYGTLYTGITEDLINRVYEHKACFIDCFTKRYDVTKLVYYEIAGDFDQAILREKRIKKWRRQWKIELIESMNKDWNDLFYTLF